MKKTTGYKIRIGKGELMTAVGLTVSVLAMPLAAQSQSFNCAKATKTSEFAICNSEELLLLDERMAAMHASQLQTIADSTKKEQFSKTSKRWLRKRNACKSDFACLELRYRERIRTLSNG